MSTKNTIALSLEKNRTVRGYEINRLPLGAFLEAVELIKEAPLEILTKLFPEQEPMQALKALSNLDTDSFRGVLIGALTEIPAYAVKVISKLLAIPEEKLLGDPAIGLDGIAEMLNVWLEVNNIENFLKAVRPLIARIAAASGYLKPGTGSNA